MRRSFQILWLVAFAAPLLAFAYVGHFSRYIADDYCTTSVALSQGLVGSVMQWYNNWAGQYTNWTLKAFVAYLGSGFPGVIPTLILVLWLGAAVWIVGQVFAILRVRPGNVMTWAFGAMVVFAIFAGIPSIV